MDTPLLNYDGRAFHRALCAATGLETQTQVAVRLGISKSRYSQVLSGATTIDNLLTYAQRLGADEVHVALQKVVDDHSTAQGQLHDALEAEVREVLHELDPGITSGAASDPGAGDPPTLGRSPYPA